MEKRSLFSLTYRVCLQIKHVQDSLIRTTTPSRVSPSTFPKRPYSRVWTKLQPLNAVESLAVLVLYHHSHRRLLHARRNVLSAPLQLDRTGGVVVDLQVVREGPMAVASKANTNPIVCYIQLMNTIKHISGIFCNIARSLHHEHKSCIGSIRQKAGCKALGYFCSTCKRKEQAKEATCNCEGEEEGSSARSS